MCVAEWLGQAPPFPVHRPPAPSIIVAMPLGLTIDPVCLADLCRRHHISRLELFGSRAKGTARPDSDVDLLVTFEPGHTPGLEFFGLAEEFAAVLGRPVDLFTRDSVERSPNPYKRASILSSAELLYAPA